ncbi:MAG: hydrogenase iron-sulfur subunit [Thermodesulfobacteriota bacterium]
MTTVCTNAEADVMNHDPLKIYVFYCANSLDARALRQGGGAMRQEEVKTISLPCSGKVNLLYLLKAFEKGADGVLLVTCKPGDCQFLEGNLRARKRSEAVDAMLAEIGFGKGRMRIVHPDGLDDITRIMAEIDSLSRFIRDSSVR